MSNRPIGDVVIEICSDICKEVLNIGKHFKVHKLGDREFYIFPLTTKEREILVKNLYSVLSGMANRGDVKGLSRVSLKAKSSMISVRNRKSFWYRLGLALSDGSVLDDKRIIFSTTRPHTLNAIIYGFGNVLIYVARYMRYGESGRSACAINALVEDEDVAKDIINLKKQGKGIKDLIANLKQCRECLASFLAGVIDGDGAIDKDNVRISVSRADILFKIINQLIIDVKYDHSKYLLRISTRTLRQLNLLDEIANQLISEHKKLKMITIANKRFRFICREVDGIIKELSKEDVNEVLKSLHDEELKLLKQIRFRRKGKYLYAYIPSRTNELLNTYEKFKSLMKNLMYKFKIPIDIIPSIKLGKREVVIYSKCVVSFLKMLLEVLWQASDVKNE